MWFNHGGKWFYIQQNGQVFMKTNTGTVPVAETTATEIKQAFQQAQQQDQQAQQQQPQPPQRQSRNERVREKIATVKAEYAKKINELKFNQNTMPPQEYKERLKELLAEQKEVIGMIRETEGLADNRNPYNKHLTSESVDVALSRTPIPGDETPRPKFSNTGYKPQTRNYT